MRVFSGVAGLTLCAVFSAAPALAQEGSWSGYYVGAGVSSIGGRNGSAEAFVDSARDSQITYFGAPIGRSFSRERNLKRAGAFSLNGGRLVQTGRWVVGVEGRFTVLGPTASFSINPGTIRVTDVRSQRPYPLDGGYADTQDTLTANLDLSREASVRARIGLPVGERLMISAFAGPTVVQANLSLRQDSVVRRFLPVTDALHSRIVFDAGTREFSVAGKARDLLLGSVVGVGIDVQLTDEWRINGEASLARYEAIEATTPAYGGSGSRFSYEPNLYSVGISLIRRF